MKNLKSFLASFLFLFLLTNYAWGTQPVRLQTQPIFDAPAAFLFLGCPTQSL